VLSDHEQRVLEELERSLAAGPAPDARRSGLVLLAAPGCVSVGLLLAGVPAAALAIAAATAIGWLFWWSWARHRAGGDSAASVLQGGGPGRSGRPRRLRESTSRFRRWLSEAE
jgi:hypothetical protein